MTRTVNKQINLNRPFHPESMWDGIKWRDEDEDDYAYDRARLEWRRAQPPSVIEGLAAEYRALRKEGIPHEDIDPACYDGFLEYSFRWPIKSRAIRVEVAKIDDPDGVSNRLNEVQPNDEVIKGNEAIEHIPDELPALLDDPMIGRMIDEHADSMN